MFRTKSFHPQRRKLNGVLRLEKLEQRNMLSAAPALCVNPADVAQLFVPEIQETELGAQFFGNRFRQTPFISPPTTEILGLIDDVTTVTGSNSFFDRIDRYEFNVAQDGQLDASVEFPRTTRSGLFIFDANRQLVARAYTLGDGKIDGYAELSTDLRPGNYVAIVVRGFGHYELNFDFNPTDAADPAAPVPSTPDDNGSSNPVDQSPRPVVEPVEPPVVSEPVNEPVNEPIIQPNTPSELPDVPYYGGNVDWNLNAVGAPEAWNAGQTGEGVVVAVIDTGVNVRHSDLDQNIWTNDDEIAGDGIDNDRNGFIDDYYGWNFIGNSANVNDDNGHGTHVAGTIAAERNGFGATGVAPDAEVMSIKVLNSQGSGFVSAIANGIRYAVNNGANIINLSLGGGFSSTIASAIGYAAANDVLVVAAAGNESARIPSSPATLSSSTSNLLSVGAYDRNGSLAGFSNDVGNSGAIQVDAPGVSIYSTAANGRYAYLSGTSMATPHVAGVAALTLSAQSNLTAASLRNVIVTSANRFARGSDARGAVNAASSIPLAAQGNQIGSLTTSRTGPGNAQSQTALGRLSIADNALAAAALQVMNVSTDLPADSVAELQQSMRLLTPLELSGAIEDVLNDDQYEDELGEANTFDQDQTTDLAISELDSFLAEFS